MRSYVDPIINAAVISQIELGRDLGKLLQLDFPEIFLPTFLHEGTHHACFQSPLGTALALLRMRAYRRATHLRTRPSEDHWDLLEDVLRQEATMELLRPISEGLACFSEFDSVPGTSNVITTPMLSTFFYFGGIDHELKAKGVIAEHSVNLFLFSLLYRARLDPTLSQRRENVLAGHFAVKFGGHLPGYMAIKNLWRNAKAKSRLAEDAELFSMYLRSFFYDDYGFVAVLLDESLSEHNAVNAICRYFVGRQKQLIALEWDPALKQFEEQFGRKFSPYRIAEHRHLMHVLAGGLQNNSDLHERGLVRLEKLVSELIDDEGLDEIQKLMCAFDLIRLQKRELFCLGSLEADIEVNAYHRVIVRPRESGLSEGMPLVAAPALEDVKEGKGQGSVEFYLIPADNARVSAIVRGRELVHVHFEGPISEARCRQLYSVFGTRSSDLRIIEQQEANLEFVIARDSIGLVRDQAKITAPQAIDELHRWLATMWVNGDRWRLAAEVLAGGGVFELCGNDGDFIRGLAFLGVASSVNRNKSELADLSKNCGIDLVELCRKAKIIEATTGFPTIIETQDEVIALV